MNRNIYSGLPQPQTLIAPNIRLVTYLSVAAIFMYSVRFLTSPTVFLSQVVIIFCIMIMIMMFEGKLYLDRTITFLLGLITFHGMIGVITGFSQFGSLVENIAKATLYYLAFSSILKLNQYNLKNITTIYLISCVAVAYIGFFALASYIVRFTPGYNFSWLLNSWHLAPGGLFGLPRAQSILAEPSHAAYVMGPAIYFSLGRIFGEHKSFISLYGAAAILLFIFLTASTTGYTAIFAAILVTVRISIKQVLIGGVAALLLLVVVRPDLSTIQIKLEQVQEIFESEGYAAGIGSSSYSLYIASVISASSIKDTYGFGSGIGSFEHAYERYIGKIDTYGGNVGNYQTGSSLFNRTMTELGVFGVLLWLTAIVMTIKGLLRFSGEQKAIHLAMAVGFVPFFVRQGTYQNHGLALFLLIFIINYRSAMLASLKTSPKQQPHIANTQSLQYQSKQPAFPLRK